MTKLSSKLSCKIPALLFVTSFDAATEDNHRVLSEIKLGDSVFVSGDQVTVDALEELVPQTSGVIFFASHGTASSILANDAQSLLDVDSKNISLFYKRTIIALACLTAQNLGYKIYQKNAIWFGFEVPVSALPPHKQVIAEFRSLFCWLISTAEGISTPSDVNNFFVEYEQVIESCKRSIFKKATKKGGTKFVRPIWTCVLDEYLRELRVWVQPEYSPMSWEMASTPANLEDIL